MNLLKRDSGPEMRALWVGLLSVMLAGEAVAQGTAAVVGQSLALAGLAGGVVAGAYAGYRHSPPRAFWPAFGIYLGLLAIVASTRSGDMAIVPLALALGGAAGLLPFAAAYFGVRWCWFRMRNWPPTES